MSETFYLNIMRPTNGLRTRFFPKSRIGQGLISMAPWLNLVLLLLFFMWFDRRLTVQPGVVVDRPVAAFSDGTANRLAAVVLSIRDAAGAPQEIVVFDDARYLLGNEAQMAQLQDKFSRSAARNANAALVLYADSRVMHGTVMRLMNMAQEAGIRSVNLAERVVETGRGK